MSIVYIHKKTCVKMKMKGRGDMNISNTISYDSTYSKNDLSQRSIVDNVPAAKENVSFENELNTRDKFKETEEMIKEEKISEIRESIKLTNRQLRVYDRKLDISIHEKTSEIIVKVVDTSTDEVIREIPSEDALNSLANRREIAGILMDRQI